MTIVFSEIYPAHPYFLLTETGSTETELWNN